MDDSNKPNISVREYIKWIPGIATEPTSTLVLTTAGRRYVDIRILKPTDGSSDLPNNAGPLTALDWAFAGTSRTSIPSGHINDQSPVAHSTWTHWVDSKTEKDPETTVNDEGDMYPQKDGIRTLEVGRMLNEEIGVVMAYEECWVDVDVVCTDGKKDDGRQGDGDVGAVARNGGRGKKWCMVLMLEDEGQGARGMVIRVGQFCQGIIRVKGEVCVERWMWEEWGEWKRVARLGRLFLPCALAFEPERVLEGSKIDYGDYKWEVNEVFGW